ncbi:MAG: hypothetical protein AAB455_03185 [Patescibacteria group bacterium]
MSKQRPEDNGSGTVVISAPPPTDPTVDLDQFLNLQQPGQSVGSVKTGVDIPDADRVVIVGIFADDSGSMTHLYEAVKDGFKLSVEAFRGAKGSDFYLDVRGFMGVFFQGLLKDVIPTSFDRYDTSHNTTPLCSYTIAHLKDLHAKAEQYRRMGIPTTVSLLIITDGDPYRDEALPTDFANTVQSGDYIVGMGIAQEGNDAAMAKYGQLFKAMGATKIVTSKSAPAEVRHAINQFSQSVASIAAA